MSNLMTQNPATPPCASPSWGHRASWAASMAGRLAAAGMRCAYNRRPRPSLGWLNTGRTPARRARPPWAPTSSSPAWATTTTCDKSAWAPMAPAWHRARRFRRLCHHGPSAEVATRAGTRPRQIAASSTRRCPAATWAPSTALTVMCGGEEAPFARIQPVPWPTRAPSRCWARMAPGQLAKMVTRSASAGIVQGLAEAIALARRPGWT